MAVQLITPNPNIECTPGMCLQYVREAYALPLRYGSATEAWVNSPSQHPDLNFPDGMWLPVWFSLADIPQGHVALRAPDGSVYSSSDNTSVPHHHPSLDDLLNYYAYYGKPLTYLGWSEDVAGYPVVSLISTDSITAQSAPAPTQEDNPLATASQQYLDDLINAVARLDAFIKNPSPEFIDAVAKGVQTRKVPYFDPATGKDTGYGTTLATMVGYNDLQHAATRSTVEHLPVESEAPFDVEAFVTRLKTELPPEIMTAIRAQINK